MHVRRLLAHQLHAQQVSTQRRGASRAPRAQLATTAQAQPHPHPLPVPVGTPQLLEQGKNPNTNTLASATLARLGISAQALSQRLRPHVQLDTTLLATPQPARPAPLETTVPTRLTAPCLAPVVTTHQLPLRKS